MTAVLASNAPGMSADIAICLYSWGDLSPKLANAKTKCDVFGYAMFGLLSAEMIWLQQLAINRRQCKASASLQSTGTVGVRNQSGISFCSHGSFASTFAMLSRPHSRLSRGEHVWQSCFRGAFGVLGLTRGNGISKMAQSATFAKLAPRCLSTWPSRSFCCAFVSWVLAFVATQLKPKWSPPRKGFERCSVVYCVERHDRDENVLTLRQKSKIFFLSLQEQKQVFHVLNPLRIPTKSIYLCHGGHKFCILKGSKE